MTTCLCCHFASYFLSYDWAQLASACLCYCYLVSVYFKWFQLVPFCFSFFLVSVCTDVIIDFYEECPCLHLSFKAMHKLLEAMVSGVHNVHAGLCGGITI